MNRTTRLGLKILAAAALMGVLGDGLLRVAPWGVNLLLWAVGLAAAILALARYRPEILNDGGRWLLAPAAFFSLTFAWRDSPALKMLNVFALLVTLSLLILRAQGGKVRAAGLLEYALGGLIGSLNAILGALPLLFSDIDWKDLKRQKGSEQARAVARGLVFAIPLFLIFGGLLVAADAVFENIVRNVLHLNLYNLVSHCILAGFFAWIVAGFLRGLLMGKEAALAAANRPSLPSIGITETAIVLGLLDGLFFGFVVVQLRYFFGGPDLVQKTLGLTYAEYARRGFFELVAVAALALPLVLTTHGLLRKDHPSSERIFRWLAGSQVLLLFVIMASALERMRLYQQEYGLTELRIYTTALMGWLAVVFVWFGATVLRGERKPFAFGALVAGYVMIAALYVLNPDALIVRENAARALGGHKFDWQYAARLSADAVPPLVAALPNLGQGALDPKDRCALASPILQRWGSSQILDWRTRSVARDKARRIVEQNEVWLLTVACSVKSE